MSVQNLSTFCNILILHCLEIYMCTFLSNRTSSGFLYSTEIFLFLKQRCPRSRFNIEVVLDILNMFPPVVPGIHIHTFSLRRHL